MTNLDDAHKNKHGKGHHDHGNGNGYGHHKGCICFTEDTLLTTSEGLKQITDLFEGDLIQTRDNGMQPIRWIGHSYVSAIRFLAEPNLMPVKIKMDGLDLYVSQQHRLLVIAQGIESFIPAKGLLHGDRASLSAPVSGVTYYHVMFDKHEIILANNCWCESLFPGEEAVKSMTLSQRMEINMIFPELYGFDLARPHIGAKLGKRIQADTLVTI